MIVFLKYHHDQGLRVERFGNVVEEVSYHRLPSYVREALHLSGPIGIHIEWNPDTDEYGAIV